jgi:hypothetical protein
LRKRPPFRKLPGVSIHSQSGAPRKAMRRKRLPCGAGQTSGRRLKRKIAGTKPRDEVAAGRTMFAFCGIGLNDATGAIWGALGMI